MHPAVTVTAAAAMDMPIYLEEIGKAIASQSVSVQPQVTGKIIDKNFKDGDDVHKDQWLFKIDEAPFIATQHQAEGQKKKDQAMLENAESVVKKDTDAMKDNKGALAQTQVDADTATMLEAKASIEADDAAIEAAKINVKYCTILSPIDGKAGVRLIDVGNVVTAPGQGNGSSLLTIQTLDPIYVDFTITEAELTRVRQFMAAGDLSVEASLPQDEVQQTGASQPPAVPTAAPGTDKPVEPSSAGMAAPAATMPTTMPMGATAPLARPRSGKLTFLDNAVQDGTGTIKLRAELENHDHHFWPNQFVNVKLILQTKKGAIMIPRAATQISQTGPFVFTVDAKSVAHITPIGLGQRYGDMVMIDTGLNAGDKIVVTGQGLIFGDGMPVMVVPSGPPTGAPAGPGGH